MALIDDAPIKVHALQFRMAGVDVSGKRVLGPRNRFAHGTLILHPKVHVTLLHMAPHASLVLYKLLARLAEKAASSLHHVFFDERLNCKENLANDVQMS
jgi:hypothetical protein